MGFPYAAHCLYVNFDNRCAKADHRWADLVQLMAHWYNALVVHDPRGSLSILVYCFVCMCVRVFVYVYFVYVCVCVRTYCVNVCVSISVCMCLKSYP